MARDFDSSTDRITTEITSGFPITAYPVTLAAKIKPSANQFGTPLAAIDKSSDQAYISIETRVSGADLLAGIVARNGSFLITNGTTSLSYADDIWYSIVGIFRSATDREIYVDGVSEGTGSTSVTFPSGLDRVSIGKLERLSTTTPFAGDLAECIINDYEWTTNEITAYSKGIPPLGLRQTDYYSTVYGNLSPEAEFSGVGNAGTVTGTSKANHPPVELLENYL